MESPKQIIYFFGRCLLLLHAILSRSNLVVDAGTGDMTTLPPNFVPVIDGATGLRPADLPEILAAPDAKGEICTLASLGVTVVVWPEGDESRQVRIDFSKLVATVSTVQNCYAADNNNPSSPKPILVITWTTSIDIFQLCFYIFKDDKNWTVNQIIFAFNTSLFPLDTGEKSELLMFGSEANALNELQAPLGRSYRCYADKQFPLLPLGSGAVVAGRINNNNSNIQPASDNATLIFKNFQLQPFIDNQKVFGEEVLCREDRHRRRRNSSVTIAVGSSLVVVSVVTVMGYAIFRYVKIKAVGYDTME
ncbi:uncharacterized protein LOC124209592 [Daphnia pulex]|uniref:uncharacterized protein LOC124209592 n=1 Tax=Daphnia pulex TaxID=6669 RepID=UPI001EDFB06C|nr:uncharacterized protein LOC124209592 [Daphnia pulex]